jgi:hypothetical protein
MIPHCVASIPVAKPIDGSLNSLFLLGLVLTYMRPVNSPLAEAIHRKKIDRICTLVAVVFFVPAVLFSWIYWCIAAAIYSSIVVSRWRAAGYAVSGMVWWPAFAMFCVLQMGHLLWYIHSIDPTPLWGATGLPRFARCFR